MYYDYYLWFIIIIIISYINLLLYLYIHISYIYIYTHNIYIYSTRKQWDNSSNSKQPMKYACRSATDLSSQGVDILVLQETGDFI